MLKTKASPLRRILRGLAAIALVALIAGVVRYAVDPKVTVFSAGSAPSGDAPGDAVTRRDSSGVVPRTVEVGDEAPEFTAIGEDGKAVRLSDFRGRWLVLVFLRGHW